MEWRQFDSLIEAALAEDGARHDVTTDALIDPATQTQAEIVAKADGVICGLPLAARAAELLDDHIETRPLCDDGHGVSPGTVVATVAGPAGSILEAERTMLNFLQRLSGIATLTRGYCRRVAGTSARIFDTRKTTPGWRALEKYAVRCGGGHNHRMGLSDQVLIKDNHIRLRAAGHACVVEEAVLAARRAIADLVVEVEVVDLQELQQALRAGADIIMLDNSTPALAREASELLQRECDGGTRPLLEASGGITLETVCAYAEAGVDRISIGALTHSASALDIAMYIR